MKRLSSELWTQWHALYLQTLQCRQKWQSKQPNLQPDDIVLLKEIDANRRHWPLVRVLEIFPGDDGLVRVVKIRCSDHEYKRAMQKLVPLIRSSEATECVQVFSGPGE